MANDFSHLRTTANQDGAAILDTRLGKILTLNSTGARIWDGLLQGKSTHSLAVELSVETGERLEVITEDVRHFVAALKEQKLCFTDEEITC